MADERWETRSCGVREWSLGCCWVSHFEVRRLAELLNLPETYLPSEILVLGYPAREREPRPKKPLEEVVFSIP
jgi:nitroreductase